MLHQTSLGHPEDEVELEKLMHDWDIKGQGSLDFDAFISIVSSTLKVRAICVCRHTFHRPLARDPCAYVRFLLLGGGDSGAM